MSYREAQAKQARDRLERDYRAGRAQPAPWRITLALDAKGLEGPEVDLACGAVEPDVDQWETGEARPTWDQLLLLAELCGVTPEFLMPRPSDEPMLDQGGFVCGPDGCATTEPIVQHPPYREPAPVVALPAPPATRSRVTTSTPDRRRVDEPRITVSLRLKPSTRDLLDAAAREAGITRQLLIRTLIAEALAARQGRLARPHPKTSPPRS